MDPQKLFCLFAVLLITNSPGWCVNMNEIPSAPPQDSIMAGPREIAQVRDWADLAFGIADPAGSGVRIEIKENSFGEVRFGRSCMGTPIRIGDREFEHGIGTHTYSELIVHLPPDVQEFRAFVGINNNVYTQGKSGSAIFVVEVDGKEIFRSPAVRGSDAPCSVAAKIPKGAQTLVLKTEATEDGEANDHTDWADAHLVLADSAKIWLDNQPDSLLGAGLLPFSFLYNGKLSQELMGTWSHESRTTEEADWIRSEVSWTDPETKLRVQATARSFRQYPAVDWVLQFQNTGSVNSPILEDIQALDMPLRTKGSRKVTVRQNHGDVLDERSFSFLTTGLHNRDSIDMAPRGGRSSNGAFPFFEVQYGDHPSGAENLIAAVGWSGQWAANVTRTATGSVRLRAGMERTRFYLQPGESVRTPRILLMTSEGDLTLAHQRFRRLMLFEYFPKVDGKPILLPFALQCFDRYSWTLPDWATEAGQIKAAEFAAQAGFDTLWFDAAWFIGGFPNGVGNWEHKPKEFPNGLRPVSDACHAAGLKFLIWFEPERVAAGSQIAREHPEFVIGGAEGGLFQLNDPDARRWLTDLLSQRISEYGIDIYRNDFNMDPLSFWHRNDEPDREGITEIHYIEGLYEMWDELRARHPGLWIDNCSSGGRRIDLETCMRSVPLWRSDTNCSPGREEWNQSHTAQLCSLIPLNTSCAWMPDSYVMRSTMTAGLICQWDYLNGDFPMKEALSNLAELKELRTYWYGDFYPLTSGEPSPELWCGWQLHRPDLDAGMAMVFRRTESPYTGWTLRLQALNPKAVYRIEIREGDNPASSEDLSGEALMAGREIKLPPRSSLLVRYKKLAPSGK